jgi:hypothetical protein
MRIRPQKGAKITIIKARAFKFKIQTPKPIGSRFRVQGSKITTV